MRCELSSRERLLAAVRRQEPDHVPFWALWRNRDMPFRSGNQVGRAEAVLELGLDDTLLLEPPLNKTEHYDANRAPGIRARVRHEEGRETRYPLLIKEYETPAGVLRQVVRRTDDWPYGEDVRLFSDHNISRALEFPVKGEEDLPRLRHVLAEPVREQLAEFREQAAVLRGEAQRLGVLLEGGWTALGDAALWLVGTEALLTWQLEQPELLAELLDLLCDWELGRMDLLLEAGVEAIVHSAWYETTDFWTPRAYRRLLKPRLARLVSRAHEAGVPFNAIITTSWQALQDDLVELGIDSLVGVDPVQGKADLAEAKRRLGPHMCLWGGVNSAVTLGRGTPEEIRAAAEEAIHTLGQGGGFVLYPVDQLGEDLPWQRVETLIEAWRQDGSYPLKEVAV